MLWIFVLALIMPISLGSCDDVNLAKVTWEHAVNSQAKLQDALSNDKIQMIEADVVLGHVESAAPEPAPESTPAVPAVETNPKPEGNKPAETAKPTEEKPAAAKKQAIVEGTPTGDSANPAANADNGETGVNEVPIMAHPPNKKSDLSLNDFLDKIVAHNKDTKSTKGVKLDFKSIDALKAALTSWKPTDLKADLWINADIIPGPGKKAGDEVNAEEFFKVVKGVKDLENKTLSIGWTTDLGNDKIIYNQDHVDAMLKAIEESKISAGYPITFPVRAAIAAESKDTLKALLEGAAKDDRQVTFTVWSGEKDTDKVDSAKLQEFINEFGLSKVYVDVPTDLASKLKLDTSGATMIKFGLLNLAAIAFAMFFRNGLH